MNRLPTSLALLLPLLANGCVASKSSLDDGAQNLGAESTSGSETGADPSGDSPGMTSTSGPSTATGAMTTGANPTSAESSEGNGEGVAFDVASLPEQCSIVDNDTCFDLIVASCEGNGNWNINEGCVGAVLDCFPIEAPDLAPEDVIEFCHAELDESCAGDMSQGCGQALCECTVGYYPFEWGNCFDLLTIACKGGVHSDCGAVLESCYPGATTDELDDCHALVVGTVPGCECPTCGDHGACENALADCMTK